MILIFIMLLKQEEDLYSSSGYKFHTLNIIKETHLYRHSASIMNNNYHPGIQIWQVFSLGKLFHSSSLVCVFLLLLLFIY